MITIRKTKDIFAIDKSLTRHLWDFWGVPKPDWTTSKSYWWYGYDKYGWMAYAALRVHDEESMYLGPTYVKQEYRGKGIQNKFLAKRIAFAKELGFKKLLSSTSIDNYPSSNNLIKNKFYLRPAWFGIEPGSLYWQKDI
jgi:GNAT superfamily N-acetyltransferase